MDYELKTSKSPLIVFILFILIIVGTIGVLKFRKNPTPKETVQEKKEVIKRKIEYYTKGYYYEINQDNDKFDVIIKSDADCQGEENCNPYRIDNYKVTEENDIKDLTKIFDDLFKNKPEKELTIDRNDITIDQATILDSILKEPAEEVQLEYKILDPIQTSNIKETGYKVETKDDKVIVTISMGEKPTAGYSIEVESIKGNANNLKIMVIENTPTGDAVAQVITTPAIQIEFNALPTNLIITNAKNGKVYNEIKEKEESDEPTKETEEYKIIGSQEYSKFTTRGFVVSTLDDKTLVTVAMGEQSTGGYSISVTKIDIKNNNVVIHVEEKYPPKDSAVTQAFSQPIVQIAFAKKPNNIVVINQNGQKISQIENER